MRWLTENASTPATPTIAMASASDREQSDQRGVEPLRCDRLVADLFERLHVIDRAVRIELPDRLDHARRELRRSNPPFAPAASTARRRLRVGLIHRHASGPRSMPSARVSAATPTISAGGDQLPLNSFQLRRRADRALILEVVPRHRLAEDRDRRRRRDVGGLERAAGDQLRADRVEVVAADDARTTICGAAARRPGRRRRRGSPAASPSIRRAAPPRPSPPTARSDSALDAIEHVLRELQAPVAALAR